MSVDESVRPGIYRICRWVTASGVTHATTPARAGMPMPMPPVVIGIAGRLWQAQRPRGTNCFRQAVTSLEANENQPDDRRSSVV